VVPVTLQWAEALQRGDVVFERDCGIRVVPGWAGFAETVPMMVRFASSGGDSAWGPYLVFDDHRALVGTGGWKGPPVDGVAELGYAVAPPRQNRGIASELVTELLASARRRGLTTAVAHTLAAESASTSVLRKCGFHRCGEHDAPEDGPVWRWERVIAAAAEHW